MIDYHSDKTISDIQLQEFEVGRSAIYAMKPGYFHNLILSFPKKKTGGFQKCKVHGCNFKGFKVTSLQSSASLGFEPGPPM